MSATNIPHTISPEKMALVKSDLEAVVMSCYEAIAGAWDKSNDGFEDMITVLDQVADSLGITLETEIDKIANNEEAVNE